MRVKINLDTDGAAARLVGLATSIPEVVTLTDGSGMTVSAKSLLGALYARFDFREIWLETEKDHFMLFKE